MHMTQDRQAQDAHAQPAPGDIRITGSSTAAGGRYRRVRVVGEGTFDGPVQCEELHLTGTLRVGGPLDVRRLHVTGDMTVEGSLQADHAHIRGQVTVRGNLEAEHLDLRGGASVDGLLSAEELLLRLYGPVRAQEIGGGRVVIREGWRWFRHAGFLAAAEVVEGDELHVEKVKARTVRGRRVEIGPDSEIDRVEYTVHLQVSPRARVGEVIER